MAEQLGDAVLDLRADGTQLQKDMDQAKRGAVGTLKDVGQSMRSTGTKLTKSVTLPIVAAGAAIVGVGAQFESTMSRITGLVGISKQETDKLGAAVQELAPKVGKGPNELAEALFTVTSAGFRGAEAMDVLEAAAKASAAGLGETRSIAEAATGVINAYGSEVIDAARATDIVVATARAGNFATEELAGSLGRVTPFAQAAGASFEDVGGAIALLTRRNNDAAQSTDQVASMMRAFAAPTQQTIDALDELGLSTDQAREMMSEKGLVGTLRELDERLGGNRDALRKIIPDSNGFAAALQILNAEGSEVDEVFGDVADSTGITDEAFAAAEDTAKHQLNVAMAEMQSEMIDLAGDVMPSLVSAAQDIIGVIRVAADWFGRQDEGTRKLILAVIALVAAIGPLVFIIGALISPIGLVVAGVALLAVVVVKNWETILDATKRLAANVIGGMRLIMDFFLGWADTLISTAAKAFGWVPGIGDKLKNARDAVKDFREKANAEMSRIQTDLRYSADVSPAMREVQKLRRSLQSMPKVSTVTVGGTRGGRVMHEGGFVPGPRNMEVPAVLQGGEFVMSHDMLDRGTVGGDGAQQGPLTVNLKIAGSGNSMLERTLLLAFQQGLIELEAEQR